MTPNEAKKNVEQAVENTLLQAKRHQKEKIEDDFFFLTGYDEPVIRSNIRKFKPIENITRKVDEDVETDVLPDEGDILSDRMKKKRALKKEGIDLANITQTPRRTKPIFI